MAVQSTIYTNDGVTRTFPSTKHISTIQHVGVYRKRVIDNVWVIVNISDYNLVQNSIIFDIAPDIALYSQIEIRVADDATEITTAPSDIATVSGSIASVNTVATNITSVNTVATNIGAIGSVSANIANVNAVGGSILNVNAVASDLANVNAVALDLVNINLNATNITSINTNATNIVAIQNASANATLAQKWASELENVIVSGGLYSAYHWAMKAAASAASLLIDAIPTNGSTNAVSSDGVFDALAGKQATLTFDAVPINGSTNPVESNGVFDAIAAISSSPSGVRQTVQTGSVDTNGFANFVSIGTGLNVNIAATTTPLKIHAAGGAISADRLGTISADKTLLLPANSTSYIYESVATNGVCTSGSTTLAPIYQFGGTPAVTNGQFTYNISEGKSYFGNGTTAPQAWMTFEAEAITNATNVTSVITYALNGIYDSGWTATIPSAAAHTSKNSNLGVQADIAMFIMENTTTNLGYAVGDQLSFIGGGLGANFTYAITSAKNTIGVTANGQPIYIYHKTSPAGAVVTTAASWKWKLVAKRGW